MGVNQGASTLYLLLGIDMVDVADIMKGLAKNNGTTVMDLTIVQETYSTLLQRDTYSTLLQKCGPEGSCVWAQSTPVVAGPIVAGRRTHGPKHPPLPTTSSCQTKQWIVLMPSLPDALLGGV